MNEATQQQLDLTRFVTLDEYASNRTGVFPGGKGAVCAPSKHEGPKGLIS